MQTFLPYPNFKQSAQCLDNKRLGKQRVECLQILKAIANPAYGWQNHPAVKMWRDYPFALTEYAYSCIDEWVNVRKFNDTCWDKIKIIYNKEIWTPTKTGRPQFADQVPWITPELCASHRSNLLRKDPVWYGKFGWTEPAD